MSKRDISICPDTESNQQQQGVTVLLLQLYRPTMIMCLQIQNKF